MSKYIELLTQIRRKNKIGGSNFFLISSDEINYTFDPTLRYMPGSVTVYNQNFYLRNTRMVGYNPGTVPTNTDFWIPANPGRDLGHHPTQAALDAAYPNPQEGAFASIGETNAFILYSNAAWNAIAGGGGRDLGYFYYVDDLMAAGLEPEVGDFVTVSERRTNLVWHATNGWVPFQGRDIGHFATLQSLLNFFAPETDFSFPLEGSLATLENIGIFVYQYSSNQWHLFGNSRQQYVVNFNSNLDTVSVPILFKGAIGKIIVDIPSVLNNYSFEVKLDSLVSVYAPIANIAALEAWINNNVTTNNVKWVLRIIAGYANEQNGETSLVFEFEKIYRF